MNTFQSIFFLSFLYIFLRAATAQNVCLDCSKYIDKNCVVNTTGMGYLAKAPRDKLKIAKLEAGEKPDSDFEDCINPGYKLIAEISGFICFWSPNLKCQAVIEKSYRDEEMIDNKRKACCTCASYCGCEFSSGFSHGIGHVHLLSVYMALLILCY